MIASQLQIALSTIATNTIATKRVISPESRTGIEIEWRDGARGATLEQYATALVSARATLRPDPSHNGFKAPLATTYHGLLIRQSGQAAQSTIDANTAAGFASEDIVSVQAYVGAILPENMQQLKRELTAHLQHSFEPDVGSKLEAHRDELPKRSDLLIPMLIAAAKWVDSKAVMQETVDGLKWGYAGAAKRGGGTVSSSDAAEMAKNALSRVSEFLSGRVQGWALPQL